MKGFLGLENAETRHRCAGGIVVRLNKDCVEFLLLKQIRRNGEVQWVMPKGHIDKGETSEGAAIREVREEAGVKELRLKAFLGKQQFRYREEHGNQHEKAVSWYLMETRYESRLSLNTEEGFVEAKWLPYQKVRKRYSHEDFREWVDRAAEILGVRDNT